MLHKIGYFVLLITIAITIGILGPNTYTTVECNNVDMVCKVYKENSVFKTKVLKKNISVNSSIGRNWYVLGVGQKNVKNLACYQKQYSSYNREGKIKTTTKYLLVPIDKTTDFYAINKYSSNLLCETDKAVLQTYLSSNSKEPFRYVTSASWFRYLWYLLSVFLVFIAFSVLFKGKILSKEDEEKLDKAVTEEDVEQVRVGIKNIIKHINNIDKIGANIINDLQNSYNKYNIDIKNDKQ